MNWETEQIQHVIAGNFDEKDHLFWASIADDLYNYSGYDVEKSKIKIAENLAEHFSEDIPTVKEPYISFLRGALDEVDWEELADSLIEMVEEL